MAPPLRLRLIRGLTALLAAGTGLGAGEACGDETPDAARPGVIGVIDRLQDRLEAEGWLLHGQSTYIVQGHPRFRSPYTGEMSLTSDLRSRGTVSGSVYLGRRLWDGAVLIVNPEMDVGSGLSNSTGVAGALNNEAFRIGTADPKFTIPRLFLRQTIGLGGGEELQDAEPLHFRGRVPSERLTITAGKVSVWDIFDDNRYSHDPRRQFLNWAFVGNGAIDFAADARGYTPGLAVEYERKAWAARAGVFQVAREVNAKRLDDHLLDAWQLLFEVEQRFSLFERPGRLRELAMLDRTRAITYGRYPGLAPISATDPLPGFRRYRTNYGFGLNLEQELTDELGLFARASWNPGVVQQYMFTEIDRHLSAGLSLAGGRWGRPDDTVGLAAMANFLSGRHRDFYAAGNLGFIVGDGRLRYRPEQVLETYYDLQVLSGFNLALDYQLVRNPGYNADRGPVSVFGIRLHAEF